MRIKKIIKIGVLSLALIAAIFVINNERTNAATTAGQINFIITGATNTQCTYGTSWNMGSYNASLQAFTASGALSNFVCTDTEGRDDWSMTIQAISAVTNGNTPIPATGVFMQATPNYVSSGDCSSGINTTTMTQIGTTGGTIMAKISAINQICQITTTGVVLNIEVPAAASIGIYTGSLSITLPW